jgi:hypothetical protein
MIYERFLSGICLRYRCHQRLQFTKIRCQVRELLEALFWGSVSVKHDGDFLDNVGGPSELLDRISFLWTKHIDPAAKGSTGADELNTVRWVVTGPGNDYQY